MSDGGSTKQREDLSVSESAEPPSARSLFRWPASVSSAAGIA